MSISKETATAWRGSHTAKGQVASRKRLVLHLLTSLQYHREKQGAWFIPNANPCVEMNGHTWVSVLLCSMSNSRDGGARRASGGASRGRCGNEKGVIDLIPLVGSLGAVTAYYCHSFLKQFNF